MEAYRVNHVVRGAHYHVLASSAAEAIEIVTLRIGDVEGASAWEATAEKSPPNLHHGVVIDAKGNPIHPVEF